MFFATSRERNFPVHILVLEAARADVCVDSVLHFFVLRAEKQARYFLMVICASRVYLHILQAIMFETARVTPFGRSIFGWEIGMLTG